MWDLVREYDNRPKYKLRTNYTVLDKDGSYDIEIEVPRYKNENLSIEVNQNIIEVVGNINDEVGFIKRFRLTSDMDGDNITSNLAYGVLTINIPLNIEAKPKQIQIK